MDGTKGIVAGLVAMALASGCATKDYGRMDATHAATTCAEIEEKLAEVNRFRTGIAEQSAFGAADVLALLIDFGIGNAMAKSAALRSADERAEQLRAQQRTLGCATTTVLGPGT